jgi:hypothetical protein
MEYAQHWRIFDDELAQRFPPPRKDDHQIKLLPDAPAMINCKVYLLSLSEREAARAWLEENK